MLKGMDGILVPGGFGIRGVEGKIAAVTYARENKIPYFGICLGMQCAVIEVARNLAGLQGGNMRIGAYPCKLKKGTAAYQAYGKEEIAERHRHRYEFNNKYLENLAKAGLVISGLSPDGELVEIVELKDHPWFLGCQFHPEFRSTPRNPHPLFTAFIGAAVKKMEKS